MPDSTESDPTQSGIDDLLIRSALDPELRRRLTESPETVFAEYHLTAEQQDILRHPDDRMLALFGKALARQRPAPAAPPKPSGDVAATKPAPLAIRLPDLRLVVTIVPCVMAEDGQFSGLSFAAWVNPLPEGADAGNLTPPDGAQLPGQPLAPLHAVLNVATIQLPDRGGLPQIGMTASLLQSSNLSAPLEGAHEALPDDAAAEAGTAAAPDIWIVGLGIQTAAQMTREVEQAIRMSREVLYLDTGVATGPYLHTLCPRVTSLFEESYAEQHSRSDAYDHMARRVADAAANHGPVTFAIHGHPLVAASAPFRVMELARARGLRVHILPGISAIDTVLADLRVDPVVHGIQMYEATDLLLRRRPLQPDVPALLWQIGTLETCLHSMRIARPERFHRFIAHLRLFYPADHEICAVYSSPHPLMPARLRRFALGEMDRHAAELHSGFTLYIPPMTGRPIQDYDLLEKLYSIDHLRRMTGTTD